MGWEWHNRKRTRNGTWAFSGKDTRITIRVSFNQREQIFNRAVARRMDMTEYLLSLVDNDLTGKGEICADTVQI